MSTTTRTSRATATALWLFFTAVTAYTLLADVARGAEPVTTGHILSIAALVAALAAGHHAWPELRRGRLATGGLLGLVALAATAYVMVSAAARNAETATAKAARIEATNTARAREERQLALAIDMHKAAITRLDAQCVRGNASKGTCDGIRATITVYDAAIRGHNATLAKMAPALPVNGGYAQAANVIAALPGITARAADIEQRLATTMPVLVVLISELASIAFGIMAFRAPVGTGQPKAQQKDARAITERAEPFTEDEIDELRRIVRPGSGSDCPASPDNPDVRTVRKAEPAAGQSDGPPAGGVRLTRDQAEADLITMLALGQSVPSQESLCRRWNRPRQTVSDWLRAWESEGLIPRRQALGRNKMLAGA